MGNLSFELRRLIKLERRRRTDPDLRRVDDVDRFVSLHPALGERAFLRYCRDHVRIPDATGYELHPFTPYVGQLRAIRHLVHREWILGLKGRQMGFTTLAAVWAHYLLYWVPGITIVAISQEKGYAEDFLDRVRLVSMHIHPRWLALSPWVDNKRELWVGPTARPGILRSLAGSDKAARSMTGDLVFIDEASRVKELEKLLGAAIPMLEQKRGQLWVNSTSAGPTGKFYQLWQQNYGAAGEKVLKSGKGPGGYRCFFFHWSERDGRDQAWYQAEKAKLDVISPAFIRQEHPNNPTEAFEYAAGRIYAGFETNKHVGTISLTRQWTRYRAIDWGHGPSPFVCLWAAYLPGGPPALVIDPACTNLIREMLAYRWSEKNPNRPEEDDDHGPDALRYLVTTESLWKGCLHVYREMYLYTAELEQTDLPTIADQIHELTGWKRDAARTGGWRRGGGEMIETTVCDRSESNSRRTLRGKGISPIKPHAVPRHHGAQPKTDAPLDATIEGIKEVQILVLGTADVDSYLSVERAAHDATLRERIEDTRQRAVENRRGDPERRRRAADLLNRMRSR